MKSTGIIRRVDELGRVVLPKELRRSMGIREHDEIEIYVEGEQIVLQKFLPKCIFCGRNEELANFYGKNICRVCISDLRKC